jgi:reactive chlorine resistance protein C
VSTRAAAPVQFPAGSIFGYTRARALEAIGTQVLRYGLVLVFVLFGTAKFTAAEAEAIKPLVSNSPFMSWMYSVLSDQGVSRLIGSTELLAALLIALRPISARASTIGSALAIGTFLTTLSFLFTTPGALGATHPAHGFLLKDIVLLAASIAIGTEALRAVAEESEAEASA